MLVSNNYYNNQQLRENRKIYNTVYETIKIFFKYFLYEFYNYMNTKKIFVNMLVSLNEFSNERNQFFFL